MDLYYSQFEDGEDERMLDFAKNHIEPQCIACIATPPKLTRLSIINQYGNLVQGLSDWVYTRDAREIQYGKTITKTLTFSGGVTSQIRNIAKAQFGLTTSISKTYSTTYKFIIDPRFGSEARVVQFADEKRHYIKIVKSYLGRPDEISYTYAYEPIDTVLGVQYRR